MIDKNEDKCNVNYEWRLTGVQDKIEIAAELWESRPNIPFWIATKSPGSSTEPLRG